MLRKKYIRILYKVAVVAGIAIITLAPTFSVHAENYPSLSTVSSTSTNTSSSTTAGTKSSSSSTSSSNITATTSKMIIQKASGSQSLSLEEARQWKPETQTSRQKEFIVNITSGTNRIEVFYTAGKNTPRLQFTSTSGKNVYVSQKDEMSKDNNFKFITRANLPVEGFDNMRYMVIYISNTSDPGKWHLKVTLPDDLTEIACVTTEVPEGWENFNSDMRCLANDLWFWYCDSSKSEYKDDPIGAFNKMWAPNKKLADVDNLVAEEPEPEDNTTKIILLTFALFLTIAAVIGIMIYMRYKNADKQLKLKREKIVERENQKVKRKKSRENDELDKILDDFSSDYIDDDEYLDYFKREEPDHQAIVLGSEESHTNPDKNMIKDSPAVTYPYQNGVYPYGIYENSYNYGHTNYHGQNKVNGYGQMTGNYPYEAIRMPMNMPGEYKPEPDNTYSYGVNPVNSVQNNVPEDNNPQITRFF